MNPTHILRRFSIRTRMLGAIATVLGLLALVGAAGLAGLSRLDAAGEHFIRSAFEDSSRMSALRMALGDVRRYEKDLLLNHDNPTEVASYQDKWLGAVAAAQQKAKILIRSKTDEGSTLASAIDKALADYADKTMAVISQIKSGSISSPSAGNKALAAAKAAIRAAQDSADRLAAHLAEEGKANDLERAAALRQAFWIFGLAVALAVCLVAPLTLMNMNSICEPISQAQALADRIATGDLTSTIDDYGSDEAASLLQALGRMQVSLQRVVNDVRVHTDQVVVGSTQMASGNSDLSHRTEQQASSLQETAAAMEELGATVKQNADNARQGNQLALGASEVAVKGGEVVGQVVETMKGINDSSKRIADIIGVIDGIAFQTNILALNAAVEAARAGEQGRGFAVVAGEVRNLAQRSAESAKEIKGLISASVGRVEQGSLLVDQAGATMQEIVAAIQRVTEIMGSISSASAEQSSGVAQVGLAVANMDHATQQNAELVEQSAAAAQSLRDEADQLLQAVAMFKLPGGSQVQSTVDSIRSSAVLAAPAVDTVAAKAAKPQGATSWRGNERRGPNRATNVTRPDFRAAALAPINQSSASVLATSVSATSSASGTDDEWTTF
jgi:methyl-accepting chemotaxis protein